jgi:CHAT domain-containing protein
MALAGANQKDRAKSGWTGILTSEEISTLDFSAARLVVLSVCESGLGSIWSKEGVLGLRRAFQIAGARSLICSMWSIEDRTTQAWMKAFYGQWLAGETVADAVRAASCQSLADRRARGLSTHPSYWGGFVAVGDWR